MSKEITLSTREHFSRSFNEFGVVAGQGSDIKSAVQNLIASVENMGSICDAVIAMRITSNGQKFVAYGTAIKWS